mmetsp:Transcript_42234/g.62552  ORF Transcript_42234/g.62552 Transcript_42234/m.62552 type:complete len:222 (+) Transcript_42234:228-893(+)
MAGTKTTLRKSISHSFCIISTSSCNAITCMAGSTPCCSTGTFERKFCQVLNIFSKLKYIGNIDSLGSGSLPSSGALTIRICKIVKTGISLKLALNFGDSFVAFSMAAAAISCVISPPFCSFSPSSGFIVSNIRAPIRSRSFAIKRASTSPVDLESSSGDFSVISLPPPSKRLNQIFPRENGETFICISVDFFNWSRVALAMSGETKKKNTDLSPSGFSTTG